MTDASPVLTGYLGCVGFFAGVVALNKFGARYKQERAVESLFLLACSLLPMLVYDGPWFRHGGELARLPSLGVDDVLSALRHTASKLLGVAVSVATMGAFYWLFEEYHASFMSGVFGVDERINPPENTVPYYHNYFRAFRTVADLLRPAGAVALLAATLFVSELVLRDRDGYWALGTWLLSALLGVDGEQAVSGERLLQHALSCGVQFFYSPLMFGYLCENLAELHYKGFSSDGKFNYMLFWRYANNLIFSVDVCFAAIGYAFSASFWDNQIRSVEPTVLGWASALACYQPFFHLLTASYIDYTRNPPWNEWIAQLSLGPAAKERALRLYGTVVLLLQAVFAWCTVSFGLRYSNLTYRGLVTSGPYYFTKHPAYIVKILAFAMISVPWTDLRRNAGWGRSIRNVATLALLAMLYCVRARTEEAHLAAVSPDYLAYAAAIDQRHQQWFAIN